MELTTSQAVQKYGVFPNVLHRMILMGRLEARKDANGRWLISKQSLDRWNRTRVRRAAGIPASSKTERQLDAVEVHA